MTLQQFFQISLTVLFVVVLVQLLVVLTQFQIRTWRDDRRKRTEDNNPALKEPSNETH